jgi:hypothetical protein
MRRPVGSGLFVDRCEPAPPNGAVANGQSKMYFSVQNNSLAPAGIVLQWLFQAAVGQRLRKTYFFQKPAAKLFPFAEPLSVRSGMRCF